MEPIEEAEGRLNGEEKKIRSKRTITTVSSSQEDVQRSNRILEPAKSATIVQYGPHALHYPDSKQFGIGTDHDPCQNLGFGFFFLVLISSSFLYLKIAYG